MDSPDGWKPQQNLVLPQIALLPCATAVQQYWIMATPFEGQPLPYKAYGHQGEGCQIKPSTSRQHHIQTPESMNIPLQSLHHGSKAVDLRGVKSSCLKYHQLCTICGRTYKNVSRHMRTHEAVFRFNCVFPRESCLHKTGSFIRNYQFKEHLLHDHFIFHDSCAKKYNGLTGKLSLTGSCCCGREMTAKDFLENHIMMKDEEGQFSCSDLRGKWNVLLRAEQS